MAKPTTRKEFRDFCLRKMGHPVIKINLDNDQIDDRIDEALQYYADYHFDGSELVYYKHQITDTDMANRYIDVPDEKIFGISRIFNIGDPSMNTSDIFNIRYQIALNDLYSLVSTSMVPYYLAMEHLSLIQELLVGRQPIRYNRHMNRIHVDMNWDKTRVGQYLLFEGYKKINPDEHPDIWNDRWLQNYTVVLLTEQWGHNLSKFTNMQLVGGVKFNADKILDDARAEREKLEKEMLVSFSLPTFDLFN